MDIKKLQATLLARGIRIKDDDPVFVLVALNEIVLEDMTKKYQQALLDIRARHSPVANVPAMQDFPALSAYSCLVILTVAAIAFVAVFFIGTHGNALLHVLLGLALGAVMSYLLIFRMDKKEQNASTLLEILDKLAALEQRFGDTSLWSEEEFQRVASVSHFSNKTLEACHAVLVNGLDQHEAKEKKGVMSAQLSRALFEIRKHRKQ